MERAREGWSWPEATASLKAVGHGLQAAEAKAGGGLAKRVEAAPEAIAQECRVDLCGVDALAARQAPLRLKSEPAPAGSDTGLDALVVEPRQGTPGAAPYRDALDAAVGTVGSELASTQRGGADALQERQALSGGVGTKVDGDVEAAEAGAGRSGNRDATVFERRAEPTHGGG